jgi:hypothetical protein
LAANFKRLPGDFQVFFSCSAGQASYEDAGLGRGVFLNYVLEGMAGLADKPGGASRGDGNGMIDSDELFSYAAAKTESYVAERFRAQQIPELFGPQHGPVSLTRTTPRTVPKAEKLPNAIQVALKAPVEKAQRLRTMKAIADVAAAKAKGGDSSLAGYAFAEAENLAELVDNARGKDEALAHLVHARIQTRDFLDAKSSADKITEPETQCRAICAIARAQAENGDVEGAVAAMTRFYRRYYLYPLDPVHPEWPDFDFGSVVKDTMGFIEASRKRGM